MITAPVWARQFAGGVADATGRHALWPNAAGCLVAIDLATGQRMWRSIEPMWPLLLNDHRALALAFNPPRILALAIDAPEETELWRSDPLPWPSWAAELTAPTPGMELHSAWLGAEALVCWRLRALYQGGAAAARDRTEPSAGACTVDPASGLMRILTDWPEPPVADGVQTASDDPSVLARATLGRVNFHIVRRSEGERTKTILRAEDAVEGRWLWDCELDEIVPRAPRALRQ
jgi:hypothetical protein